MAFTVYSADKYLLKRQLFNFSVVVFKTAHPFVFGIITGQIYPFQLPLVVVQVSSSRWQHWSLVVSDAFP